VAGTQDSVRPPLRRVKVQSAESEQLLAQLSVIEIFRKGQPGANSGEAAEFRYLLSQSENGATREDADFEIWGATFLSILTSKTSFPQELAKIFSMSVKLS
jgi:hypothetical protein